MTFENNTITTKRNLIRAFAVLDEWFDKEEAFQRYKPPGNNLVVYDLLTQIVLTSSFMMTIVDSGNTLETEIPLSNIEDNDFLKQIKVKQNNVLTLKSLTELRIEFRDQLDRCLCYLELIEGGEALYKNKTKSSKQNLYQCIDFLERYLLHYAEQLNKIEEEYLIQPA